MVENTNKSKNLTNMIIGGIVVAVIIAGVVGAINGNNKNGDSKSTQNSSQVDDYTGKDAKVAYETLKNSGYDVKFVFDRNNNGGFTEEGLQEYVKQEFDSGSYDEMPFTVIKQSATGKTVTLTIEYASAIESENAQKARESALESKLGIVESMTACQQYGERNYRDFKMHSIVGKIAEYASDDDTWFLKYTADANGYKNMTMECYVTGTSSSPVIKSFNIY